MKIIKNFTVAAAALIAATLLFQPSVTVADGRKDRGDQRGDRHRGTIKVNWTKHATEFFSPLGPTGLFATIAGSAGGDIGAGNVTGEAFRPNPQPDGSLVFEAVYHFYGTEHSFTVHWNIVQKPDQSGVMRGVVTDGWMKGHKVAATYTGYACDQGVNQFCFDGALEILRD
ncbi:MAG: hypothetical protein ACXW32_13315 [Limisphaerales bacterium]